MPSIRRMRNIQDLLLRWFETTDRAFPWRGLRATKYEQVVAEVLLQRTQAGVVNRMFAAFISRYPSWQKLAEASTKDLENMLKPLGLWKRRAASLRALAAIMATRRGRYPKSRAEVESLPGVGQYICNAILMFDQGRCEPLLDVNLARVLERVFGPRTLSDIRYDPYLQKLAVGIVQHESPSRVNWAFLDLASLICTIRAPKCEVCPLKGNCCYAQTARFASDSASQRDQTLSKEAP